MMSREKSRRPLLAACSLSLRLILVIPFLLQIAAAVGLVGYLSHRNGQKAANNLAAQLVDETSNRIRSQIWSYLAVPQQVQDANLRALQSGLLSLDAPEHMGQVFWNQVRSFNFQYVYYTDSTGVYIGAGPVDPSAPKPLRTWEICYVTRAAPSDYDCSVLDARNRRISKRVYATGTPDIREQPWYQETKAAGQTIWLSIYNWLDDLEIMGLPLSSPIYDDKGQLVGVISLEYGVNQIDRFLHQLAIGKTGRAFIIERSGLLVASSDPSKPYIINEGEAQRLPATQSSDRVVRETARYLEAEFASFEAIAKTQQLHFQIEDAAQFVQVSPYQDRFGLDWLIVVVIPESDFTAQIAANTRNTIILCLISLVIAAALGIYTSRWLTQPILRFAQSAEAVSRGDWDQQVAGGAIAELQILARAFNRMAAQLKTAFSNLEQKVSERTAQLSNALDQLQKNQAQLIHTEKMSSLGQLVAGIAHEINNPVSFIHGNLNYARSYTEQILELGLLYQQEVEQPSEAICERLAEFDFVRSDLVKLLESMQIGTERIKNIVLSLRGFVRLNESDLKVIDVHRGLEDTLTILGSRFASDAEQPGVLLERDYGDLPLVECYAGQLNQVFLHILTNALDALEAAAIASIDLPTPRITIRTQRLEADWVQISISDNGPGIPDEIRSKIFDAFFTTKEVGQGSGLGLYICHQIVVDQHGGRLTYRPAGDRGAQFDIEIPARQQEAARASLEAELLL